MSLPTLPSILTTLFSPPPPLSSLPDALTTLHLLYPAFVLPALSLIDDHRIHRLATTGPHGSTKYLITAIPMTPVTPIAAPATNPNTNNNTNPHKGRRWKPGIHGGILVALSPWNCGCPAFVYEVVTGQQRVLGDPRGPDEDMVARRSIHSGKEDWILFGGYAGDVCPPICKHLLAALLVEHWGLGGDSITRQIVTPEEMAGIAYEI